jgi:hypothetical protein
MTPTQVCATQYCRRNISPPRTAVEITCSYVLRAFQVMELLHNETRDESLLTYFEHFDSNATGFVK